jgi:hypothetical protein
MGFAELLDHLAGSRLFERQLPYDPRSHNN